MFTKKNMLKIFLSFLFTILFFITLILCLEGREKNKVIVSFNDNDGNITNIYIGNSNYPVWQYKNLEGVSQDGEEIKIEKGKKFRLDYSKILDFSISIRTDEEDNISLKINGKKMKLKFNDGKYTYTSYVGIKNVLFNYFKNINIKIVLLGVIIGIVYFTLSYIFINYFEKFYKIIKEGKMRFIDIIKFLLLLMFFYFTLFYLLLQLLKMFIIIPLIIVIIVFIYGLRNDIKNRIPEIFAFLILFLGMSMAFILPAFHVPDEVGHFIKSYGVLNKENLHETEKNYMYFPMPISKIFDKYNMDIHNSEYTISAKEYFVDINTTIKNDSNKAIVDYRNTVSLPIFCYIPSAITIYFCKIIGVPFNILFLLSRITNLLIYAIIGYYSLKLLPKFKYLFLVIMLLPITIQQAVGLNQDSITNSLFILALSIILNLIYSDEKVVKKYKVIMLIIISVLLGYCKIGYFPVLFLSVLIPNNKFKNKKNSIFSKLLIILPCVLLSAKTYLNVASVTSGNELYYPLSTIYTDPVLVIRLFFNTLIGRGNLDMLTGLVDGFGWSTVWHKPLIQFIVSSITFILLLTSISKEEKVEKKYRIFFSIITVIMIGFICSSLLFGWTKIGENYIDGLQCRYFIPIAFLFYLSISNQFLLLNFKKNDLIRVLGIIIVNIFALWLIIYSYYL